MNKEHIEAAINEALAALRDAINEGRHEMALGYSYIVERLHMLLKEIV
jgi:hypothetical protein